MQLIRMHFVPTRALRNTRARRKTLFNTPQLLRGRPSPPALPANQNRTRRHACSLICQLLSKLPTHDSAPPGRDWSDAYGTAAIRTTARLATRTISKTPSMPQWKWPESAHCQPTPGKAPQRHVRAEQSHDQNRETLFTLRWKVRPYLLPPPGPALLPQSLQRNFIAKAAKDYARLRKWFGFCPACVPSR